MIEVREQNKDENLMHGDSFPITLIIGSTCRYLTEKQFKEIKTKLNAFVTPVVRNQREQLIAFMEFAIDLPEIPEHSTKELIVDKYLSNL